MRINTFFNIIYLMRLSKRQFSIMILLFWYYLNYIKQISGEKITISFIKHYTGMNITQIQSTLEELVKLNVVKKADKNNVKKLYILCGGIKYVFNNNPNTYKLNKYSDRRIKVFNLRKWKFDKNMTVKVVEKEKINSRKLIDKFIILYSKIYNDAVYVPTWGRDSMNMKRLLETFEKNGCTDKDINEFFEWCHINSKKLLDKKGADLTVGWLRYLADAYIRKLKAFNSSNSKYVTDEDGTKRLKTNKKEVE